MGRRVAALRIRQHGAGQQRHVLWRVAVYVLWVCSMIAFYGAVSYVYVKAPAVPDPATGRIYPLTNHGYVTYLTVEEWVTQGRLFFVFGATAAIALIIDLVVDPFRSVQKQ